MPIVYTFQNFLTFPNKKYRMKGKKKKEKGRRHVYMPGFKGQVRCEDRVCTREAKPVFWQQLAPAHGRPVTCRKGRQRAAPEERRHKRNCQIFKESKLWEERLILNCSIGKTWTNQRKRRVFIQYVLFPREHNWPWPNECKAQLSSQSLHKE